MVQSHKTLNNDKLLQYCAHVIGGIPQKYAKTYETALHPLMHEFLKDLIWENDSEGGGMVGQAMKNIAEAAPSLVSFTSSIVDQMPWERLSSACAVMTEAGDQAMECDLL